MLSEKHKPKAIGEFIGNAAVEFIKTWDGSPLIVHGATGTGKTLLVELAALDKGWDIVRIDESNVQDAGKIAGTTTLFGGKRLIVVENSSGDFRSALNDIETLISGRSKVAEKDLEVLSERDRTSDIYRALSVIFGGKNLGEVLQSTWDIEEQPRDVLWWVEENTPLLYKDNNAIAEAVHNIARADVFIGRINSRQYWGFLRYANALMTAGVNVSRPEKISFTRYQYPSYIINMGRSKKNRNIESAIAKKMAPAMHVSKKTFAREYIPLIKLMLEKKKVEAGELQQQFNLEEEEIEYLVS
ncbi:MAG: hypothetical protein NTU61_00885 [Candidatus Altiarchaeota archaeon]|nr:hypothetical protein [Candidatus Altiarchaeota archaeon]